MVSIRLQVKQAQAQPLACSPEAINSSYPMEDKRASTRTTASSFWPSTRFCRPTRTAAGRLCHGGSGFGLFLCCAVLCCAVLCCAVLLPCCCCGVAVLLLCCCCAVAVLVLCRCMLVAVLVLCRCMLVAVLVLCRCMLHPCTPLRSFLQKLPTFEHGVRPGGTKQFCSEACMQVATQPSCQLACTALVSAHMHCCPTSASPKASQPNPCHV